jgi:DNA-binding FrmR family transcriptional regulator
MIQYSASEKAIDRVGLVHLKSRLERRVSDMVPMENSEDKIDELVNVLFGLVK